jgi:hypothetical protein
MIQDNTLTIGLQVQDPGPSRLPKMGRGPAGAPPGEAKLGGAILRLDLATKAVTSLYTHSEGSPLAGPNKMVGDEWGDLWITDVFTPPLTLRAKVPQGPARASVSGPPGAMLRMAFID